MEIWTDGVARKSQGKNQPPGMDGWCSNVGKSWDFNYQPQLVLGGGFKDFLFAPLFGEDSYFD